MGTSGAATDGDRHGPSGRFRSFTLRTTAVDEAHRFYSDLLGDSLDTGLEPLGFTPLPKRARERGAPSHWLGTIGTPRLAEVLSLMVSGGGRVLEQSNGDRPSVLLDPHGSIVSISADSWGAGTPLVGWHLLNTTSLEPAWRTYSEAFHWYALDDGRLPGELGAFRTFAWEKGGPPVGMIAETARAAHIHTHWLFHFDVLDLNAALELVGARGGRITAEPLQTPAGRIAVCDDPTGAAVALREPIA